MNLFDFFLFFALRKLGFSVKSYRNFGFEKFAYVIFYFFTGLAGLYKVHSAVAKGDRYNVVNRKNRVVKNTSEHGILRADQKGNVANALLVGLVVNRNIEEHLRRKSF